MSAKLIGIPAVLAAVIVLEGCVALAAGGAAAGAATVVDRRTTGTMVEDETIELKTRKAFEGDRELDEQSHLNITSYNTHVLLTGETPTEALRARAEEVASKVPKVTRVYNEITVGAPSSVMTRSSDTVITSKVKTKLVADEHIDGVAVKVVTENGVVYLMGLLTRAEADRATEVARKTGGVQKVVKLIQYTD
jgi:osmotically-inducible protein OsmY